MKKVSFLFVICLLVSCGQSVEMKTEHDEQRPLTAEIDTSAHTVSLPLDKYLYSEQELRESDAAIYLATDLCMQEKGFPVVGMELNLRDYANEFKKYGLWNPDTAVKYGYMINVENVSKDEENKFHEKYSDVVNSVEYSESFDECVTQEKKFFQIGKSVCIEMV